MPSAARLPPRPAALVTGASSGLGEALARRLAARGLRLILCSENAAELERVRRELAAGGEVRAVVLDLSRPGAAERLHRRCRRLGWPVEVLVNCAGIFLNVDDELADPSASRRLLALHVQAPTALCLAFGREMLARRRGWILNVASISALFPDPSSLTYGPSKRYLLAFSEELALQWRAAGLRVCALVPGGVRTNFFARNRIVLPALVARHLQSPERVARIGLRALFRGRRRRIVGLRPRLQVLLFKVLLTPALFDFSRRMYARLRARSGGSLRPAAAGSTMGGRRSQ
jgi:short-subunit dehydrogenase